MEMILNQQLMKLVSESEKVMQNLNMRVKNFTKTSLMNRKLLNI